MKSIGAVVLLLWVAGLVGWVGNVYKLAQTDFEAPYKEEVIRIIGIPVVPLGAIVGYLSIEDGTNEN
jgi:hypothetical protein